LGDEAPAANANSFDVNNIFASRNDCLRLLFISYFTD